MKRLLSIFSVIALIASLMALSWASPVKAQGTLTFDFTTGLHGWTLTPVSSPCSGAATNGVQTAGVGIEESFFTCSGGNQTYRSLNMSYPADGFTITSVTVYWTQTMGSITDATGDISGVFVFDASGPTFAYVVTQDYRSGFPGSSPTTGSGSFTLSGAGSYVAVACISGSDITGDGSSVDPGGQCTISRVDITESGFPTPTPTPSPTPIPNPPDQGGTFAGTCLLMGDSNATFTNLPGLWDTFGEVVNPPGQTHGALVDIPHGPGNGGNIFQTIFLDPVGSYRITVHYHSGAAIAGQLFRVSLGSDPPFVVEIANSTDPQTWQSPYSVFTSDSPGGNAYTFKLMFSVENPLTDDPALVWDSACIDQNVVQTASAPAPLTTDCQACIYSPKGGLENLPDDVVRLFQWLFCGLRQLVVCFLASFLNGIWAGIVRVITFMAFINRFAIIIILRIIQWNIDSIKTVVGWATGWLFNIIQTGINLLRGLLASNAIADGIGAILRWFGGLFTSVFNFLAALIPAVVGLISNVISIIVHWVGLYLGLLGQILSGIPIFFRSLIEGVNSSPTSIPIYAPTCTDETNILFWPCLGSYVLDLTIFEGPMYLAMLVAIGALAFDVLMWSVRTIQEALST